MKLNIRGEKVTVTQSMKNYITEKLSKMDKYFENPDEINVNVLAKIKGLEQIIEVTALTKKFTLRAEESNEDFYAAVDLVINKLERQIRKNKDRLNRKYKNIENLEFNFSYEPEDDEEEAILQIELLNHDFFVFKNIDEECVSVLYKRKDNNYGIINVK